jgi:predicted transposase/invertase (TIGR01784 family)
MSKITNPMSSMHPCIHAIMQSCNIISHHLIPPIPHYSKSLSQLYSFSHLPISSASHLPSLPPWPPEAKRMLRSNLEVEKSRNIDYNFNTMNINTNEAATSVDGQETPNSKYDSAWKEVTRKLFKDFLEFFFPVIHDAIDFTKKIEFLDKELSEIAPDSNVGDRVADVLVKVHLKDGTERYVCIIIHIEIQGQTQGNFMERMFIYFYRAFDKRMEKTIPVMSAAILTDDNVNYRPDEYLLSYLGFELRMRIPIVKVIDFKLKKELREKLEKSRNPMAMVVRAQLKSFEVKKEDDNRRFEVTKELMRECYRNGYPRDEMRLIMKFFGWVIRLPETFKDLLYQEIKKIEEEYKMEYIPLWERDAFDKGIEEGIHKGIDEGIHKGIDKGIEKKTIETAKRMLEKGFDLDTIIEITGIKREEIEKLSSAQLKRKVEKSR